MEATTASTTGGTGDAENYEELCILPLTRRHLATDCNKRKRKTVHDILV